MVLPEDLNSSVKKFSPTLHSVNTPFHRPFVLSFAAFAAVITSLPLQARVGETQDGVERRLLQPNLGKTYFKPKANPKDKDSREEERTRAREEREQPFNASKEYFPAAIEGIYWKSAVAGQMSSDNGWKIHVFYVAGRSALEAYKRVGEPLNEFEVRALLAANRGSSSWKKTSNEGGGTDGIGYDYELEDGSLRASHKGSWLMIYSVKLDIYVIEQQKSAKENRDKEKAKQQVEQANKAPESVLGL